MSVAVLVPVGLSDEWRAAALDYVLAWYARHFPSWTVHVGQLEPDLEWSKGAALAMARQLAPADASTLVLADADSFTMDPASLADAVAAVELTGHPYATPHGRVYRLTEEETGRVESIDGFVPRLGHTCRPVYEGPLGGGITVVSAEVFDDIGGVDPRFLGWGGEDICLGYALQTLHGDGPRIPGSLVHLWHPHPAPDLRGSEASEQLVAEYKSARGVKHRMRSVLSGEPIIAPEPLPEPVRFTMTANRTILRLPSGERVKFTPNPDRRTRSYSTADPDEVEQLRQFKIVREETRR